MSDQDRDKEQEKRDTDGQGGPINPDTVREPKPGERGSEAWTSGLPTDS